MARKLTPEQHRDLAAWASIAAERHTWKAEAARYEAELREQWELAAGAAARELHESGVSKSKLMQAYGTRDMHTINRLLGNDRATEDRAVPVDPPPLTESNDAPALTATVKSEGFVEVTLNNYGPDAVSVDGYRFEYYQMRPKEGVPRSIGLRRADERELPDGLAGLRSRLEFRQAVAQAAGIEV